MFWQTLIALISFVIQSSFPSEDLGFVSQFSQPISECLDCVVNECFGVIEEELFCARFTKFWQSIISTRLIDSGKK